MAFIRIFLIKLVFPFRENVAGKHEILNKSVRQFILLYNIFLDYVPFQFVNSKLKVIKHVSGIPTKQVIISKYS